MNPEEGTDYNREPKVVRPYRGFSIVDLFLRILAIVGTLGSAVAMGTTDETLPFSTRAFIFQAQYDDIPAFRSVNKLSHEMIHCIIRVFGFIVCCVWFHQRFFVISNGTVCGYLSLSLPMAIYHVIRKGAARSRALLIFLDAVKTYFSSLWKHALLIYLNVFNIYSKIM